MTILIDLLSFTIQSAIGGVIGNSVHAQVVDYWKRQRQPDIEDIYIEAFQQALSEIRPALIVDLGSNESIELIRDELRIILRQENNRVSPATIDERNHVSYLANEIVTKNVLVLGGHQYTVSELVSFVEKLVEAANTYFLRKIAENDQVFRQIILQLMINGEKTNQQILQVQQDIQAQINSSLNFTVESPVNIESKVAESASLNIDELQTIFRQINANLLSLRTTIRETGITLNRPEIADIINWLETTPQKTNFGIVTGRPGDGKSVVMQMLLKRLMDRNTLVLAIRADHLDDVIPKLPAPILDCVKFAASKRPIVVLIDQLDTLALTLNRDVTVLRAIFNLLGQLNNLDNVHVIAACRIFDLKVDPHLRDLPDYETFPLRPLSNEEINRVLHYLGKGTLESLPPVHQKLLRIGLFLDLYVQVVLSQPDNSNTSEYSTLDELYGRLWDMHINHELPDAPDPLMLKRAVYHLVDEINARRIMYVPKSVLDDFPGTLRYLQRVGFIHLENDEVAFLHQTLFSYCYARQFLGERLSISSEILSGSQGFFHRPQMKQVLEYLRSSRDKGQYVYELTSLLFPNSSTNVLLFHMRYLLISWIGSITEPIDAEYEIVQRIANVDEDLLIFIRAIQGNSGWLKYLEDVIPRWLTHRNESVIDAVVDYLQSVISYQPDAVLEFLEPYLATNDNWKRRIAGFLWRIDDWQSVDKAADWAIEYLKKGYIHPNLQPFIFHNMAASNPAIGCYVLAAYLGQLLDKFLSNDVRDHETDQYFMYGQTHYERISELMTAVNDTRIRELLEQACVQCPDAILKHLLPWFVRANTTTVANSSTINRYAYGKIYFQFDRVPSFRSQERVTVVDALILALTDVYATAPNDTQTLITTLSVYDSSAIHSLISRVYLNRASDHVSQVVDYIIGDVRRLYLPESVKLYKAGFVLAEPVDRERLENVVLELRPQKPTREEWKSIQRDQVNFLDAVPFELLTPKAQGKLQELKRRFPEREASKHNDTHHSFDPIKAPVPPETQKQLSDEDWLRLMRRYDGSTEHGFNGFTGGIHEFAQDLQTRVKEDPERFYRLLGKMDSDLSIIYFAAIINGLASSENVSNDLLFSAFQRFSWKITGNYRIGVSSSLALHSQDPVPSEIIDTLIDWALHDPDPIPDDEKTRTAILEDESNTYDRLLGIAISAVRGAVAQSVCVCLLKRETPEYDRAFQFIEKLAEDASDAVRVAALHELGVWQDVTHDVQRTLNLLIQTIQGHPLLLTSVDVQHLIYWMSAYDLPSAQPYLDAMLRHQNATVRESGAQIVCTRALLITDLQKQANWIVTQGDKQQRKGAATIYARYLADERFKTVCENKLRILMNDVDEDVRKEIGLCFVYLREYQLESVQSFISEFVISGSIYDGAYLLLEYLVKVRITLPGEVDWMLDIIKRILKTFGDEIADLSTAAAQLQGDLVQILRSLYDASEYYPDKQAQVMQVFDETFRLKINEAFRMLQNEDKEWSYA